MRWIARARHELARRPWLYWSLVAAVAACASASAHALTKRVEAARDSWGETAHVIVATRSIEPGDALAPASEARTYPTAVIPEEAVLELPPDAVARQRIATGEVVVAPDVVLDAAPRSLVPDGWLAVAVAEHVPSGATVGDPVVVAADGIVLADDALVVADHDDHALVAVPARAAPMVAAAVADLGGVSLLVAP